VVQKKATELQRFRTVDLVLVLGAVAAVVGISASILSQVVFENPAERARFGAETLAHQMAASDVIKSGLEQKIESSSNRGPASVAPEPMPLTDGKLGRDPWDQPYNYKVFRDDSNRIVRVVVWSAGPNKTPDSQADDFAQGLGSPAAKVAFRGDDVGFVYDPSHAE
jgi:hypothetical protein